MRGGSVDVDVPERDEAAHDRLLDLGVLRMVVGASRGPDRNRCELAIVSW